jgi:chromosome segregation protein
LSGRGCSLRLKAIELENFKTFAGKKRIPFIGNFVGITGPNGSGKSNVLDAILFILGPKSSKSMRVENLKELIFDGGKDSKPASHCSVTLLFDNDGREVALKRVVRVKNNNYYSYYYMNDKASSLSVFDNFFSSNGMEGHYNIVPQGDINKIVTSSAFEKRRIIENVAGVSRFDEDIERSERKKAEVEENVMILEGRLEEVKVQLKSLEQDRNKALKYLDLKDKLQRTRADLLIKQIHEYSSRMKESQSLQQGYEDEIKKLQREVEDRESELNEKNERVAEVAAEIEEKLGGEGHKIQEQINECNVNIKTNEELLNFYELQLKKSDDRRRSIVKEIKDLEKKDVERSADEIKRSCEERERELEEKKEALRKINEDRRKENAKVEELNQRVEEARKEKEKLFDLHHGKALALEEIESRFLNNSREAEALENDLRQFELEEEETKKILREREKRAKELSSLIIENSKRISLLETRRSEIEGRIRELKKELVRLDREYSKAHTNGAVSAILRERNLGRLKGIIGTVGERVRAKDERYATAIAVTAGNRIDAIITRTDEDAARAIEFLKRENLGRAQFLPMSKLIAPKPMGKALIAVKDSASLGFASSLVTYEPEIKSAVEYVFGTTVVVNDLTNARRLMGGVRLVTLDGELIESSGAMVGGSKIKIIAESALLPEAIEREINEKNSELETLSAELTAIDEEERSLDIEVKKAMEEQKLMIPIPTKESRVKEYRERVKAAHEKLKELKAEKESIENDIVGIKEMIAEKEKLIDEIESEITQLTPKKVREKIDRLESEIESLQSFMDVLKKKEAEAKREVEEKHFAIEQRKAELERIESGDSKSREEIERAKKAKEEAENELKALLVVKGGYDEKVGALNDEKEELTQRINVLRIETSKIRDRIDTTKELVERCRNEIEKLSELLNESENELKGMNMSADIKTSEKSIDELKAEMKSIEGKMFEMEPVNQRALEQYDEVAKRANEIESSIERLNEQKKSLISLMNECRMKKKEAFISVFDSINDNFKAIYARISNGGQGELVLENRDDPFAGGLKIVAQPNDKKLQSIERLSGGEKSVAALALVFAIQRISPSAFYFLDEVDMFLDNVNAEIIGKMVKENSENTQTLVVSLRKATLKEADVVYGITSVDGVSQIIGKININEIAEVTN